MLRTQTSFAIGVAIGILVGLSLAYQAGWHVKTNRTADSTRPIKARILKEHFPPQTAQKQIQNKQPSFAEVFSSE